MCFILKLPLRGLRCLSICAMFCILVANCLQINHLVLCYRSKTHFSVLISPQHSVVSCVRLECVAGRAVQKSRRRRYQCLAPSHPGAGTLESVLPCEASALEKLKRVCRGNRRPEAILLDFVEQSAITDVQILRGTPAIPAEGI